MFEVWGTPVQPAEITNKQVEAFRIAVSLWPSRDAAIRQALEKFMQPAVAQSEQLADIEASAQNINRLVLGGHADETDLMAIRIELSKFAQSEPPAAVGAVKQDAARQVFTVKGMPLRETIITGTPCDLCGETWAKHFDVFCFNPEATS